MWLVAITLDRDEYSSKRAQKGLLKVPAPFLNLECWFFLRAHQPLPLLQI